VRLLYVPGSGIHWKLEVLPDILVQPTGLPLAPGLAGFYRKAFESPRAEVWLHR